MNKEFNIMDLFNDKKNNDKNLSKLENKISLINAFSLINMNLPDVKWIINDILYYPLD